MVVVAIALAAALLKKPVYSASAQVLIPQQPISSTLNPSASVSQAATAEQRQLNDDLVFANGDAVKQTVTKDLGYATGISTSASTSSDLLNFTAHSGSRGAAVQTANAWAKGYITASRAAQISDFSAKVDALGMTIAALQDKVKSLPANSSQITGIQDSILSLTQTVQQLQAESGLVSQAGTVGRQRRRPSGQADVAEASPQR